MTARAVALAAVALVPAVLVVPAHARVIADVPAIRGATPVGPALAGSSVVWAQRSASGWEVVAAATPRARRVVARAGARVTALAASRSHVAFAAGGVVWAGPRGGPVRRVGAAGPGVALMSEDGAADPAPATAADPGCGKGRIDAGAGVALAGDRLVVADTIPRCGGRAALHRVIARRLGVAGAAPHVIAASGASFGRLLAAGAVTGWTVVTGASSPTPSIGGAAATRSVDAAGATIAFVRSSGSRYGGPVDATAMAADGTLAVAGHVEDSLDSESWVTVQPPGGAPEQTVRHPSDGGMPYDHLALRRTVLVARGASRAPRVTWLGAGGGSTALGVRSASAAAGVATDGPHVAWIETVRGAWRVRLDAA